MGQICLPGIGAETLGPRWVTGRDGWAFILEHTLMVRLEAWLVMESCPASLTSRVEISRELYPKNSRRGFDPLFGERALYPRQERAITPFWLSLVPGEQHIFYLQTRLGHLPALSLALWAPYWGFAMVSVGFPASTFSHNTTSISTLHSESSDLSHSPPLIEIVGYVSGTGLDLSCPCSQTLILSPVINPNLRLSADFLVTPTFPLSVGHWAILPPATVNLESTTRLHKINNALFGTMHILVVQKDILL